MKEFLRFSVFRRLAIIALVTFAPFAAQALDAKLSDGSQLTTFGIGIHQELRNDIYVGVLMAPPGTEYLDQILDPNTAKRMSLRFISKYTNRQLTRMFKQRMAMNNSRSEWRPLTKEIKQFSNLFKRAMQPSDEINLDYIPGKGVEVYLNGTKFTEIKSHEFFKLMLNIWIGNVPPTKAFKTGITGKISAQQKDDLEARYLALAPQKGRFDADLISEPATEITKVATTTTAVATKASTSSPPKVNKENKKSSASTPAAKTANKVAENKPAVAKKQAEPKNQATKVAAAKTEQKAPPPQPKPAGKEPVKKQPVKIAKKEPVKIVEPEEEIDVDLIAGAFSRELIDQVKTKQYYPKKAIKNGEEGEVVAAVTIDVNGELVNVELIERSGSRELDRAVLKMIRRAAPYPEIPPELKQFEYQFEVPISFALGNN